MPTQIWNPLSGTFDLVNDTLSSVLEYATLSAFPATGENNKIYVAKDTNLTYRWGGTIYVEISPSLALGTTGSTAYRGDLGQDAYAHSQITNGDPHGVIALVRDLLNPIGTIREFNVATNPATLLGFGTWEAYGTGRATVAIDTAQTEFNVLGKTGGAKTHTLLISEIPSHTHAMVAAPTAGASQSWTFAEKATTNSITYTNATGGSGAHNNLQPYIVIYRWVRTA